MAANRMHVLRLYKTLIRESQKFPAYNYRLYAIRRIRDAFKESKSEANPDEIQRLIDYGKANLEIIQRQVVIGRLYSAPELIIEKTKKT